MAKKRGRKGKKGKKPKVDCKFKITNEMLKPMNESKYLHADPCTEARV